MGAGVMIFASTAALAQTTRREPLDYSVSTPRPISPAQGTTNPSAQATQRQNPYLGSTPGKLVDGVIDLSLQGAIERGLRYNLGLIESNQSSADVRADRLRALSALLPQISATGRQAYEDISYKEIGLNLPPIPGVGSLPPTSGGFGYEDVRIGVTQSLFNKELRERYRAQKAAEQGSAFDIGDSRDVVVFAVGTAYVQVAASAARVEAAKAQLASAQELDRDTADRVTSEVSPEIESLRAQVERQSAEQRVTNATNQLEKDKLTLARITGLDINQQFNVSDALASHPLIGITAESATEQALHSRSDLAAAEAAMQSAEATLRAEKAERLPVVSLSANYGAGGVSVGNFNQLYSISGNISVPVYTGGRIRADIEQAQADLARRQAEYADLKGRIAYDVRVAWLDLTASNSSVEVAVRNKTLSERALAQSRDRFANGVTNALEVVQADEAMAAANDNYIQSLYSFNVAMISLARATGGAETKLRELLGGK